MLSVHAVKSVGVALDLMESLGLVAPGAPQVPKPAGYRGDFSTGSLVPGVELARAIECGCYFSINPRMLSTKRGRAYVQQIPEEKLLLESDLPPAAAREFNARRSARAAGGVSRAYGRAAQVPPRFTEGESGG